jgi:ABC-type nickel/cobalt efflux system permease component RcnA
VIFVTSYRKGLLITLLASVLAGAVAVILILILVGTSFLSCSL